MRDIPHDLAAERAVLGSILLDREAIVVLAGWLPPEYFYLEKHAWVYEAALACFHRREPPDFATVAAELRRQERLELIGGLGFLGELLNDVPTAAHVEYYARSVERTAVRRRLIEAGGQIAALGYDERDALESTLDQAEQTLFTVSQRRGAGELAHAGTLANEVFLHLSSEAEPALSTGLADLDRRVIGWRPSRLYVVAARPGMGKTGFGLTTIAHCCRQGGRALLFSLEMDRAEVGMRLAAHLTGISSQAIEARSLSADQLGAVTDALGVFSEWGLLTSDIPAEHITALRGKARRAHAEKPIDLIVLDYLQLAEADGENRQQVIADIARGLKNLARELRVPVVALAQLNRAVEGRASKVPMLADLRESGEIEQAADAVLFLYRHEYYEPGERTGEAEIHIAKQRNGPLGLIPVRFDGPTTTFSDLERYREREGY